MEVMYGKDGYHNEYCPIESCKGLLLKSPMLLLSSPPIHQYKCLRCNTLHRRTDGYEKFWDCEHVPQEVDLFGFIEIKQLVWKLPIRRKKNDDDDYGSDE